MQSAAMHTFLLVSALLWATKAVPTTYTIHPVQVRNIETFGLSPFTSIHSTGDSNVLEKRVCEPGVQRGTIGCPFTADPPPASSSTELLSDSPLASNALYNPKSAKPKSSEKPKSTEKPKSSEEPKWPMKLDPIHDPLVLACGNSLHSCQICKSPHQYCEPVIFKYLDPQALVCIKRKDKNRNMLCATLPPDVWNSLPMAVD